MVLGVEALGFQRSLPIFRPGVLDRCHPQLLSVFGGTASYGYDPQVLHWLDQNGVLFGDTHYCKPVAPWNLDQAQQKACTDVFSWKAVLYGAARFGNVEQLEWMYTQDPDLLSQKVYGVAKQAASGGCVQVLQWLERVEARYREFGMERVQNLL